MGTPPTLALSKFMMPVEVEILLSLMGRFGNSRLFSSVIAMTALPRVSGIWGSARNTVPRTIR
jgi:hypothetical protein